MGEKGLSMRPNGVPWQLKSLQQCQESGHILRFWLRITSSKDVIEQEVVPTPREELARQVRARLGLPAGHQNWESGTQKQGRFCFNIKVKFSSVQFSRSVVSDSLQPHGPQHTRPSCPLPTPGVYSNLCPLSQWCYPTISSSVIPFSSHLQYFPASWSFQMSQLFATGGQLLEFQLQHQSVQWIFRTNFL